MGVGVTEVLLHHMFDLLPLIRRESIHLSIQFLSTATVSTQGQLGRGGGSRLSVVGEGQKCTLNTSPGGPARTHTSQPYIHTKRVIYSLQSAERSQRGNQRSQKDRSPEFSPDVSSGSFLIKTTLKTQIEMFFNKKSEVFLMFCLLC